jgi:hypothetical protein
MIRSTTKGLKASRATSVVARQVAAKLAEQSAALMLNAYMDLPPKGNESGKHYGKAFDRLCTVLGKTADREDVAKALQDLDASVGRYLSGSIDRAWHTAFWTVRDCAGGK